MDGSGNPFSVLESLNLTVGVIHDDIASAIYGVLDTISNCLSKFPPSPIIDFLQGALLLVRRTFFDQTPILTPIQTTGQQGGEISGTLGGFDAESDPITYSVVEAPQDGTVTLNPDGTFVYTPGLNFDGSDAFAVAATNKQSSALQGNWIDPWQPANSYALVEVEQASLTRAAATPQITFTFPWAAQDGNANPWNQDQAQEAWGGHNYKYSAQFINMELAAYLLAENFIPAQAVTVNIALGVKTGSLASTGKAFASPAPTGFDMSYAQAKIIKGTPSTQVDARILVNFNDLDGDQWNYFNNTPEPKNNTLGPKDYNFQSVVTHELVHALGFYDSVTAPTTNTGKQWNVFDKFVGNIGNTPAINDQYVWNTNFDENLVGGQPTWRDGLFFIGANAVAANGGQAVPLFSPTTYKPGSSVGHTSEVYFNNRSDPSSPNFVKLMNSKDFPGLWVPVKLSKIELGMMQDLGFTLSPTAQAAAPAAAAPSLL